MNNISVFKNDYFLMLKTEWIKIRRSAVWISIMSIPIVSVLIGSGSFYINIGLHEGKPWFDLWTQVALFYGYFLYPLLMSITAAYLFRLEHTGTNWNLIKTAPEGMASFWFSKLTMLFIFAVFSQVLIIILYFIAGLLLRLPGSPPSYFWWWLVAGPITIMAPGSMAMLVASRFKSFSVPIAFEFVCCFIGLGCYSNGWWLFPNTLAIIGINAQHEGLPTLVEMSKAFGGTIFWIVIFSIIGISLLNRKE